MITRHAVHWCKEHLTSFIEPDEAKCSLCDTRPVEIGWIEVDDDPESTKESTE